jgi:hypothetical protein
MLIHCTMEELTAIRGGTGSSAAIEHLNDCQECRDELDRLHQRVANLKALPLARAPRDRWPEVQQQIVAERSRQRRRLWGWTSAAAAASVALLFGVSEVVPHLGAAPDEEARYVALIEEAQNREFLLRRLDPESRVLDGRTATAVVAVEDRLMMLDNRLAEARRAQMSAGQMITLIEQRIRLIDELMRIHATKSTYVGF